jgi:hypothetical protein
LNDRDQMPPKVAAIGHVHTGKKKNPSLLLKGHAIPNSKQ